jgi:addiction module HigA family antidote
LGLSVTEAAKALGVTRQALSDVVNERAGVSVEMAIRLSKAFGSSPETWLGMQMAYDLWHARTRAKRIRVRSFKLHEISAAGTAARPTGIRDTICWG